MPDDLQKRVDELEMLAAFQERTLSQLDASMQGLYAKLEALEEVLKQIEGQQAKTAEEAPLDDD